MSQTDRIFAGSVPEFYDRFMVPLIFAPYAEDMASRVAALSPGTILETAAGSGVVARALAPKLGSDVRYVVTDLNQPMLDWAAARQSGDERITWRQADALALPFEDSSFDVVCCQFGAMFFPDRVAGYREARRVLKPRGRFLFSAWDRIEENDFAWVIQEALAELFPDDPPRFMERTPHGYNDVDRIRRDVLEAGFSEVEVTTLAMASAADSALTAAIAYCQGTPWRNEIEARDPQGLERATQAAAEAVARRFGSGPVRGRISAHVVEAVV